MRNKNILAAMLVSFMCAGSAYGETETALAPAKPKVQDVIQSGFSKVNPGLVVEALRPSPVPGVYLAQMKSGELLYVSEDGKHIFTGDLMSIEGGSPVNLTEKVRGERATQQLSAVDARDMLVFPAKGEKKRVMYVFTDVSCGYCRKLHQEIPELNAKGVEVRYLAFPRGGQRSPAYSEMVSAWCAKDRNQALTTLKAGGSIPSATCDNPVMDQFNLGGALGVRGTPAIYLDDGQSIPGYRPAPDLLDMMGL
ncbi:thioredoxin fold domain-containing protein [Parendozoicomonas haliclonae]|uniref:Thiol:disulfide interchange protein n=1 Tax=Parendozoicomonas haliclonae TaxID=1960125 RepID=A0A1X7AQ54_9GAMM|nr:thioredoxin fold domain-containing protein [Parendozoicomonas haliclonae]SMA50426.1 Thiol:disulfide interchange protein DsbC precursor [Parendozoicomonas haliclonae]